MKLALAQLVLMVGVTAGSLALWSGPTEHWWGARAAQSMWPAAAICVGGALAALVPLVCVALIRPEQVGMAALAGTAIRLLVTVAAAFVYQMTQTVHSASFTFWLMAVYLPLMALETATAVLLVRRTFGGGQGTSSSRGASRRVGTRGDDEVSELRAAC